jgi:predicted membrane protein
LLEDVGVFDHTGLGRCGVMALDGCSIATLLVRGADDAFSSVLLALIAVAVLARIINIYIPVPGSLKTILNVVLALIAVGIVLWLINTYIPMAGSIKAILNMVVVAATCVGVLRALGLWSGTVRLWRKITSRRIEHDSFGGRESKV